MFPHKTHCFLKTTSKIMRSIERLKLLHLWRGWLSNLPKVSQAACSMIGVWNFNKSDLFSQANIFISKIGNCVQRSKQLPWRHTEIQQQGDFGSLGFCSRLFFPVCKEGSPVRTVISKTSLTSTLTNGIWVLMTDGISVTAFSGIGIQSSV